jgi:cytochrome c oxidase subunit 2
MNPSSPALPIQQVLKIQEDFWLPQASSTIAGHMDQAWYAVTVVAFIFAAIVFGAMGYIMWKYRRRTEYDTVSLIDHSFKIEAIWTIIPTIVVLVLFWIGAQGYIDASVPPGDSMEIKGTAAKWLWTFTHPNGYVESGELHVPKGKPVKVILSSRDVLHSFYIPEFRVKHDAIPGAYTSVWFEATRTGTSAIECTEYCGKDHSNMLAKLVIMEPADYDKWLDEVSNEGKKYASPAKWGESLYTKNACNTCHTLDGNKLVGPTFKGLFGRSEKTNKGAVTVDENYIRESILNPTAKVVDGYQPVMPPFQGALKDDQIDALIAFLKTVK